MISALNPVVKSNLVSFDASRIIDSATQGTRTFRAEDAFELRRISKIIASSSDILSAISPLVVHEDNHLLVIFKPAGWLSQRDDTGDMAVTDIFAAYLKKKYTKPGNVFCAAVQRLDRPASGLMVLARTSKAAARLSKEIREQHFEKKYHVLTDRPLLGKHGIAQQAVLIADMHKVDRLAKLAPQQQETDVKLHFKKGDHLPATQARDAKISPYMLTARLVNRDKFSFQYEVTIETGKFHQIRALFAAHGSPLLGDVKYGGTKLAHHKDRIALMATYVSFMHPTLQKTQIFYLTDNSLKTLKTYFI